jgi:HK97 family phage major capsid protein
MIPELIEKRLRLHHENTALMQRVKADGREVPNSDEEQEWQSRDLAIEALSKQITRLQKQQAIEAMLAEPEPRKTEPNPINGAALAIPPGAGLTRLRQSNQDFEDALRGWFTMGKRQPTERQVLAAQRIGLDLREPSVLLNLSNRSLKSVRHEAIREWQERAQTITTTAGGYTIPDEMMQSIEKALLWFGPMRQAARVIRTESGADLPFPTVNDTNQVGEILAINTVVNPQDVVFGQMVLKAFKYSSKLVLVPIELMQDNGVNLPELLGELLGERIGRIQNTHFTTGAGTTLPWGIVTRSTVGVTGAAGGGVVYANIVDLEHSVDPAYRAQGASFMMHDAVIARLKKLVDTAGRPIWQPNDSASMSQGAPSTLLGYPVWPNNDMATAVTTGTRAIIFGPIGKYIIREAMAIELIRLNERYADFHQIGFLAVARADGDLLNAGTNPIKHLALTT